MMVQPAPVGMNSSTWCPEVEVRREQEVLVDGRRRRGNRRGDRARQVGLARIGRTTTLGHADQRQVQRHAAVVNEREPVVAEQLDLEVNGALAPPHSTASTKVITALVGVVEK